MSDLLSIGASGVRAYQTALDTVGENIANTGTAGYSRRVVGLHEISVGSGTSAGGYAAGLGVLASGVLRTSDTYAAAAMRSAGTDLSRTTSTAAWLDRVGKALDGNDISGRITDFFGASSALAAEPASSALRATFLAAAGNVANAVSATGIAFDQVDEDIDAQATQTAATLTSLGASLVRINDGLGRTTANTAAAAQLLDQRDAILDQMSAISDLKTNFDQYGRVTVALGAGNGAPFVEIARSNVVSYLADRSNGGTVSFRVSNKASWTTIDATGGALAGLVEGAQRSLIARDGVESIAADFTTKINAIHRGGEGLDGSSKLDLFTAGARATNLSVNPLVTYAKVAAAGIGGGPRDASNLAGFAATRAASGFEANVTGLITDNAAQLKQRNTIAEAQTAIRAGAQTALSTATGVNLDSEAIDLMRFQQAYQASSRAIQVARDTLQSILDIR
ncbi:flagellar hook-associated protein FlgK [Sphingomonas oligophenolica]|uniref:Flagellar hook-associated protein 1 n=1 Tax=Sphingomonas oligophenolica TaxID=301154 RepID=A0A502CS23_9SPHN|nr:flagellar hook-associated protein FlgK [Sphingomonas oligophenolica]TPG15678.1 flagellar hook-associated protein FlgK [Sphingomonas oligophenolica]